MHRLGTLWETGHLSTASEHLATVVLKHRLLTMLQATAPAASAPVLLCACPAGEWHEIGLLTFAYTMQQAGWQVCYLGPDLPVQGLFYGCQRLQPALVAVSMTYAADPDLTVLGEIDAVVASAYPTCAGGQAIARYGHALQPRHISLLSALTVFTPSPSGRGSG
jgi:hypothetical protein